ncbi:MAG TPA: YceI family protein [Bacteroides sp.]|nr:YceI family protein [Bacteroides sp.]
MYTLNDSNSKLHWKGFKPGGKHHGTVDVITGKVETDGDQLSRGSFEIDLKSIKNEDIGNKTIRDKLVSHLKSKDFFHVEAYPKAYFEITRVEPAGVSDSGTDNGHTHVVTGDLTIRGNTRGISFPANISQDDRMIRARTGEISLNRTKWEVNHMSRSIFAGLKDQFINDEMVVKLDLKFEKN